MENKYFKLHCEWQLQFAAEKNKEVFCFIFKKDNRKTEKFKETCEETTKSDNLQKVEDFQLRWKTIAHRLEDLSNNIKDQFIQN